MKNKMFIGLSAMIFFALSANIVAAKADFSGTWTLDASKSEGLPPGTISTMIVTQTGDRVEVETKLKIGAGEERTVKDVFVLDGKETDFNPPLIGGSGNSPKIKKAKRTSKWTASENGFDSAEETIVNAPDGGEDTIKAERHWSLSADGKTLTIEAIVQNPNGSSKIKRVFVKK